MKNKVLPPAPDVLTVLNRAESKNLLRHVLSPLERAVFLQASKGYQGMLKGAPPHDSKPICKPFNYKLEGIPVYVSGLASKQLLNGVTRKLSLLNFLISFDKERKHIPFKLREAMDDPRQVLSLSPHLRNKLCRLECYTLFAISKKGRKYFTHEQKFTKHNMAALDAVFAVNNCSHLFI